VAHQQGADPEREYIVPHENMVDVTQSMACIQCGACVASCLSMEVDPLFVGPAALAKAYRFVGDPRDAARHDRLKDLAEDPHGMYDCTHCFNCIEACPKGVAPMNQIMRLRRVAGSDEHIVDRNNGHRHEKAFVSLVKGYGLLHEAELLPRSYGGDSWFGKFHPAAGQELVSSLPAIVTALIRRKVTPKGALVGHKIPKEDLKEVQRIYEVVEAARSATSSTSTSRLRRGRHGRRRGRPRERHGRLRTGDGAGASAEQGSPGIEAKDSPTR
jgi:succinate dehydrogenase / fumarate reductase iron-sulfur subunit